MSEISGTNWSRPKLTPALWGKKMVPPAESNLGQRREFYGFRERDQRVALGNRDPLIFQGVSSWGSRYIWRTKAKMSVCTAVMYVQGHLFHFWHCRKQKKTNNRSVISIAAVTSLPHTYWSIYVIQSIAIRIQGWFKTCWITLLWYNAGSLCCTSVTSYFLYTFNHRQ